LVFLHSGLVLCAEDLPEQRVLPDSFGHCAWKLPWRRPAVCPAEPKPTGTTKPLPRRVPKHSSLRQPGCRSGPDFARTCCGPWLCAPALRPVCLCRGSVAYRPMSSEPIDQTSCLTSIRRIWIRMHQPSGWLLEAARHAASTMKPRSDSPDVKRRSLEKIVRPPAATAHNRRTHRLFRI
jgi:hypothetical protein